MLGFYKLVDFLNNLYENNTILMWAVEMDNENIVEYLLDFGADIHKQNEDGDTAMLVAAKFGNKNMVELLIKKINEKYASDPKKAQEEIAQLLNTKNKEGRTALLEVVEYGNFLGGQDFEDPKEKGRIEIIKILLENDVNLNETDTNGDNVLFLLVDKMRVVPNDKDSAILRELFEILADAEPTILQGVNKQKENLLNLAVINDDVHAFNFLKDKNIDAMNIDIYGQDILLQAINPQVIIELEKKKKMSEGWFKNKEEDIYFFRPRATSDMAKAVIDLLEKKLATGDKASAQIKLKEFLARKDKLGKTALDLAITQSLVPLSELLITKGAVPTSRQLSIAVVKNNIQLAKLLLQKSKLSPSIQDLQRAFYAKNADLVKLLLQSKYISNEVKNRFIVEELPICLQQQDMQMFDLLLLMADPVTLQYEIKDIVLTGNTSIINNFLNASKVTDAMRKEMLEIAVSQGKSAETIHTLLYNPKAQKAYQNADLRKLVLKEAVKKVKLSNVKNELGDKGSRITLKDLQQNPVFLTLVKAWEPQHQETWIALAADKYAKFRGQKTSQENLEDEKNLFDYEIQEIIQEENQDRATLEKNIKNNIPKADKTLEPIEQDFLNS